MIFSGALSSPQNQIRCLLLSPQFEDENFWNWTPISRDMGRSYLSTPLGLLTLAAILPQHWEFKVIDLNVDKSIPDEVWSWCDLVCIGGMFLQQKDTFRLLEEAKKRNVFAVVGGADPTAQPHIYEMADALILNEAEVTVPMWLESWQSGNGPRGVFTSQNKADMHLSPVPRFDLIKLDDYVQVCIQYSRGCPFNCEFCDIIEFYGRVPRLKTAGQVIEELEQIYQTGFRGNVGFIDDNFIGNKKTLINEVLPAIIQWQKDRNYPFSFYTQLTINAAHHLKLLELMRESCFWLVFVGIENSSTDVLESMNKKQNVKNPIEEDLKKLNEYGMLVIGGFINGADGETENTHLGQLFSIEEGLVSIVQPAQLVALPQTQLTKRLIRQNRLLESDQKKYEGDFNRYNLDVVHNFGPVDYMNFVPTRQRGQIYKEQLQLINSAYDEKLYMNRVLRAVRAMNVLEPAFKFSQLKWGVVSFFRALSVLFQLSSDVKLAYYVWRNFILCAFMGIVKMRTMMGLIVIYKHMKRFRENQTVNISYHLKVLESLPKDHLLNEVYVQNKVSHREELKPETASVEATL